MSDKKEIINVEDDSSHSHEAPAAAENIDDEEKAKITGDGDHENPESARRSSISSAITFPDSNKHVRCHNCIANWSKQRKLIAIFGCLSSILVCIVRLKIDPGYQTYTIHSIIVFFDMVLIHMFTATKWLSMSGESITIVSMLLYHFTKQQVWELLETTLLAMICSFHMISSRSEHWDREEELEGLIGLEIIANEHNNTIDFRRRTATADRLVSANEVQESFHTDKTMEASDNRQTLRRCSQHFFEHFLDGSAGVMYTSFLGLIIDEFIVWGTSNQYSNTET